MYIRSYKGGIVKAVDNSQININNTSIFGHTLLYKEASLFHITRHNILHIFNSKFYGTIHNNVIYAKDSNTILIDNCHFADVR